MAQNEREILNRWESIYLSPNEYEPKEVLNCDGCGEPIFEGDWYFEIADCVFCDNCIRRAKKTA